MTGESQRNDVSMRGYDLRSESLGSYGCFVAGDGARRPAIAPTAVAAKATADSGTAFPASVTNTIAANPPTPISANAITTTRYTKLTVAVSFSCETAFVCKSAIFEDPRFLVCQHDERILRKVNNLLMFKGKG
jgi:hypothetical protein